MRVFLLLVLCLTVRAENILTVCASGCSYQSIQAAVNGAADGDIIEVAAGETFVENVRIVSKRRLTLRTSRWRELPPPGYRIDPVAHAALLATIEANNSESALLVGLNGDDGQIPYQGVNTTNDTITLYNNNLGLADGAEVSIYQLSNQPISTPPAPLQEKVKYFVRDWNGGTYTFKLAATPGGTAIDLTSAGNANLADVYPGDGYYKRPGIQKWHSTSDILLQGVRFYYSGSSTGKALVTVGGSEPNFQQGPTHVRLQKVVMTGAQSNATGPGICFVIGGGEYIELKDSHLSHCKVEGGYESKAVAIVNARHINIENNYLSAAAINLLTGGQESAVHQVISNVKITGNAIVKEGYMGWRTGAGVPTGECYYGDGSGEFYYRTGITPDTCAGGACYTCQSNRTWALDTGATIRRTHMGVKNLLELKECDTCEVSGNVFRYSPQSGDAGQGWCYGLSAIIGNVIGAGAGYKRVHNIVFKDNMASECSRGIFISHSAYESFVFDEVPKKNIAFLNSVITDIGAWPRLGRYMGDSAGDYNWWSIQGQANLVGLTLDSLTIRGSGIHGILWDYGTGWADQIMHGFQVKDTILQGGPNYPMHVTGGLNDCSTSANQWGTYAGSTPVVNFRNVVWYMATTGFLDAANCSGYKSNVTYSTTDPQFVSATNSRLQAGSPYIAAATHGGPIGADVDVIEQFTIPAGEGTPSMPEQLRLNIVPGSLAALFRFTRPEGVSCQVTLYSGARITANEISDTNTLPLKQSDRLSSLVNGRAVVFVAGAHLALSPATTYGYRVDCGSKWAVGKFQTNPQSTGAVLSRQLRHTSAASAQVEYSSSLDFTSSTLTSAVSFNGGRSELNVVMPSGYRYWRWRLLDSGQNVLKVGSTELFVAP